MIKDFAWKMFKYTGNVDTFLELKRIENVQKNMNINEINSLQKVETDGNNKNEGNCNF